MALKLAHILSTSGLQPAPALDLPAARPALLQKEAPSAWKPGVGDSASDDIDADNTAAPAERRTRIWEFDSSLHCSIIGTCLTTVELRHLLGKLAAAGTASDHDLHACGVMLAGRRGTGAKLLQKALDRRHR